MHRRRAVLIQRQGTSATPAPGKEAGHIVELLAGVRVPALNSTI